MEELLERAVELEAVARAVECCARGDGTIVAVSGAAGVGKTALLQRARVLADQASIRVLAARGSELEGELGFGVVRQLLDSVADEPGRIDLFAGAAQLAVPVLTATVDVAPAGEDPWAALHGLYWLTANLAARKPLALVVDDAHWCDPASLRFLAYLAHRIQALPVLLAVAARRGEPGAPEESLQRLVVEADHMLTPAPLTVAGVRELVHRRLGKPDERFVLACHDSTGGNPFLANELIGALERDGMSPSVQAIREVSEVRPDTVARAVVLRLARQPRGAGELAKAAAVLGPGAELRHAAALARLGDSAAAEAFDALAAVEILTPRLPLDFVHPIVRSLVYEELAPGARALAHANAARLLAEMGADNDRVAAQLLAAAPRGDAQAVVHLRQAARTALARGAPDAAARYLRRAADETPPDAERAAVLHELGRADALLRDPHAVEDLERALAAAGDDGQRAAITADLAWTLVLAGQWEAGLAHTDAALSALGDAESDAAVGLETMRAGVSAYDPRLVAGFDARLPLLRGLVRRGRAAARTLALLLAATGALRGSPAEQVVELVDIGLDEGRLLLDEGAEGWGLPQALAGLVYSGALDRAEALATDMVADAASRGSIAGSSAGMCFRGWVRSRRGELALAEADLRGGLELAREHELVFGVPQILHFTVDVAIEREGMADVPPFAESLRLPEPFAGTLSGAYLLEARGRLRLARGERAQAATDLRRCGEILTALGERNPAVSAWRSELALALRDDDPNQARALAEEELVLAQAVGQPAHIGIALRACGLLADAQRGLRLLSEGVTTLEASHARLEQARTLVELGAALRRAGRRTDARQSLSQGLELARRCGAESLLARADEELRAAGARPRRRAFSGVEALTASERRVAELATGGRSNAEIAQMLFLTAKTVENHLGRVYHKLGIHSREDLATALAGQKS